jgi:hypothetical protein
MWISKELFESLVEGRAKALGEVGAVKEQVKAVQATLDWMAMRLTQVEHERAQLLFNYTGIKITTPSIEPLREVSPLIDLKDPGNLFDDVGDEEARRLGLDWDAQGEIIPTKQ